MSIDSRSSKGCDEVRALDQKEVEELDSTLRKAVNSANANNWIIGKNLNLLMQDDNYKKLRTPDGKRAYRSFQEYLKSLGFMLHHETAYKYIKGYKFVVEVIDGEIIIDTNSSDPESAAIWRHFPEEGGDPIDYQIFSIYSALCLATNTKWNNARKNLPGAPRFLLSIEQANGLFLKAAREKLSQAKLLEEIQLIKSKMESEDTGSAQGESSTESEDSGSSQEESSTTQSSNGPQKLMDELPDQMANLCDSITALTTILTCSQDMLSGQISNSNTDSIWSAAEALKGALTRFCDLINKRPESNPGGDGQGGPEKCQ
jgi:hypothetical protein